MLDDPGCWAALAVLGDRPVGVATVSAMRDIEHGRVGEIGDLYVLPEARGHGVARALVVAAAAWSRAIGCSALLVTITAEGEREQGLVGFYDRLGFAVSGRMTAKRTL
jgi:GNAT superfamily N-acetyltransferase